MLERILVTVFLLVGIINLIHMGVYILGANIYDIAQFREKRRRQIVHSPLVTVLIPAYNESKSIIRCIDTVSKSRYSNLEIIVIDDGSRDDTYKRARSFISTLSEQRTSARVVRDYHGKISRVWERSGRLRGARVLVMTKPNGGKASALNYALRSGEVHGSLVMTLDADSILHRDAVARAVRYFKDPSVVGVAANVRVIESQTVLGLLQRMEHMVGYRSKKFYTITNSECIIGGVASTYRYEVISDIGFYDTDTQTEDIGLSMKVVSQGNKTNRIVYAADVLAMTEGVQTFGALMKQRYRWKLGNLQNLIKYSSSLSAGTGKHSLMLTLYRVPMAYLSELMLLLEPVLLGYVIYLTIAAGSPALFVGAYAVITLYMLWTIWPDEHSSVSSKLSMSFYAPVMYFVFYIMEFVQVAAVIRCIANPRRLLLRTPSDSRWVSPERTGTQVAFS
jgi:biofilm PGA synthesis N-glycosyltransferase PgaC